MKSLYFGIASLAMILNSCQSTTNQIVGIYPDKRYEGEWVFLKKYDETPIDSAKIETKTDGTTGFIMKSYTIPDEKDNLVYLVAPNGILPIILEKNMITIDIASTQVKETPMNEKLTLYRSQQILSAKTITDIEALLNKQKETAEQFLKSNKDNSVGLFVLNDLIYLKNTTDDEIREYLSKVSESIRNHGLIKEALDFRGIK